MGTLTRTILGIFVKYPLAGDVKTRIAAELGGQRAAEIYAAFVADVVARFQLTADERYLCFAPSQDESREYFERLAGPGYRLWPQPGGNLGVRMRQFFDDHLGSTDRRVIVIGSDSPTLPREFVERAYDDLGGADCVLGPATDGGYYLIGMQGRVWPLFEEIEWGGSRVLEQTIRHVVAAGGRPALLPVWYDVDTPGDLQVLAGHLDALEAAGSSMNLDCTRRA